MKARLKRPGKGRRENLDKKYVRYAYENKYEAKGNILFSFLF
jgi:hypothetical protein